MATQKTINFKSIFEEIDFNETASPAKVSRKTASRINNFRERHENRGALTLAAFGR